MISPARAVCSGRLPRRGIIQVAFRADPAIAAAGGGLHYFSRTASEKLKRGR